MSKRKVLVLSYFYLPMVTAGSYRVHGLAKYLPRFGWEPIILTRHWDVGAKAPWEETSEPPVVEKAPQIGCPVLRTDYRQAHRRIWEWRYRISQNKTLPHAILRKLLNFALLNVLLLPDEYVGWYGSAYETATAAVDEQGVDAVWATGAPWTSFIIARDLFRARGLPWVADYRDPWTQPTTLGYPWKKPLWYWWSRRAEMETMRTAASIIQISEPLRSGLSAWLNREVHLIPNGYDPELLRKVRRTRRSGSTFTISFVGTLHTRTNPFAFLDGFRTFIRKRGLGPRDCSLTFTGNGFWSIPEEYESFEDIRPFVHLEKAVSQSEAFEKMRNAHLLLLFPLDMEGCCPAKTYEYLASDRPILVSPRGRFLGAIQDVLEKTRAGVMLDSPDEIRNWLESKFVEFVQKGDVVSETNFASVEIYSREKQAEKLAEILENSRSRRLPEG